MWLEYLRIATRVLRTHLFRSSLTVLSITVGAFSIVLMTSLAQSGLASLMRSLEEMGGARIIMIGQKKPERAATKLASYHQGLTRRDRDLLAAALPHVTEVALHSELGPREVSSDTGKATRTDVVAGDAHVLSYFGLHVARGRGLSEEDNAQQAKVCVVGYELARKVLEGDAVGHFINVAGVRCRVVGQLRDEDHFGVNFGFDWRDLLILPVETVRGVSPKALAGTHVLIKTEAAPYNDIVKRVANTLLVERHHGIDDFRIFDFSTIMSKFDQVFLVMQLIVGLIAGIALVVGGIGVMNMMLISVSERVREIGIRKAIGASPRDIAAQFLYEAVVLSGAGGLAGVLAGVAMATLSSQVIAHFKPQWVGVVAVDAVVIALVVSASIGVVFGFLPAKRASELDPVEAMRR
jgi:putative ABC transport system permease protein